MVSELIRLSKELFELDMVDESLYVDDMICKLYGNRVPDNDYKNEEEDYFEYNSIEDEIKSRSHINSFKKELSEAICGVFNEEDIKEIIYLLNEYTE